MTTRFLYMHQLIFPVKVKGNYVDHINHNRLDNRKENLREVNNSENQFNSHKTVVAGVGFHKLSQKWRARITVNQREIYLGLFDTKEEAIEARRKAFENRRNL